MASSKKTAVAPFVERFPALEEGAQANMQRVLNTNLGEGQSLRLSDLETFNVPSGGGKVWEIVDQMTGEVSAAPTIGGIIVGIQPYRRYYKVGLDESGGGTPPDCFSEDGATGYGDNGTGDADGAEVQFDPNGDEVWRGEHACETCPLAQWAPQAKGADDPPPCEERMRVGLLRERSAALPSVVDLSSTGRRAMETWLRKVSIHGYTFREVEMTIGLETTDNRGGISYSKPVPDGKRRLSAEEIELVEAYSASIAGALAPPPRRDLLAERTAD
jgi:hypothetical protein